MATIYQIFEGLTIFMRNGKGNECLEAGHDMVYGPQHDMLLSIAELEALEENGWFVQDNYWVHFC